MDKWQLCEMGLSGKELKIRGDFREKQPKNKRFFREIITTKTERLLLKTK